MIGEIVKENFRDIAILGGLVAVYFGATDAQPPSGLAPPEWSPLLGVVGLCGAAGILFASGKIEDMWPDDHGVYLIVINARRHSVVEVWELTEDQWNDLDVRDGPLKHLPGCKHRAYTCVAYNPAANLAISTWQKSIGAQDVIGHAHAEDALDAVNEVKESLEQEARYARAIRRQLPAVIRGLDRRRAREQNRALDPHLTPQFGEGDSLDQMIADELPDEVLPDRLAQDDAEQMDDQGDSPGDLDESIEIIDEDLSEPLEPVSPSNGTGGAD
jgi:hypothetical protein